MMYADVVMQSYRYTVETGLGECEAASLISRWVGGGLGSLQPLATKYYDYHQLNSEPGSLCEFLNILEYVDDDVRFYCSTSREKVRRFIRRYVALYTDSNFADELIRKIELYAEMNDHAAEGYRTHIAVGTKYFNDLFYDTAFEVAKRMFSSSLMRGCLEEIMRHQEKDLLGFPTYSPKRSLVNAFDDGDVMMFDTFLNDGEFRHSVRRYFECGPGDLERSLKPYVMFLSNWTLYLMAYLAMVVFGQCAFGIYWETGPRAVGY